MFESNDITYEDTPTFRQYCKAQTDFSKPQTKVVQKIWVPNKFPSVSLHTESYRLRVHQKSNIYESLLEAIEQWKEDEACIAVVLTDPKAYAFKIVELESESCRWDALGDFGWELAVRDRKRAKKSDSAKT